MSVTKKKQSPVLVTQNKTPNIFYNSAHSSYSSESYAAKFPRSMQVAVAGLEPKLSNSHVGPFNNSSIFNTSKYTYLRQV